MSRALETFVAECRRAVEGVDDAHACVCRTAPLMQALLADRADFLKSEHLRADPDHYARNAIYVPDDGRLSLFALVWNPGQWTPVHDHGTWGVVGVVSGVLEEQAYVPDGVAMGMDEGIRMTPGALILMAQGTVTTFVPNPDHIHRTGVPAERKQAVSLHLYGRTMNSFHVYDLDAGTRRLIDVPHYKS